MKKLFAVLLSILLCLSVSSSISLAKEIPNGELKKEINNDNSKNITSNIYRFYFESPINFSSKDFYDLFNNDSSRINQYVFMPINSNKYVTGVYTDGKSDYGYLKNSLEMNIKQINDIILEEDDCGITKLEDYHLIYIDIKKETVEDENIISSLQNLFEEKVLADNQVIPSSLVDNSAANYSTASLSSSYNINSSYHTSNLSGTIRHFDCFSNSFTTCSTSLSAPHKGDGNRRYSCGYDWLPYRIYVGFTTNITPGYNQTKLRFFYNSTNYNNLNVDSNEALELEVIFFNYYNNPSSRKGRAYQYAINCSWNSNMGSSAYLDTNFGDSDYEVHMCVGCDDTSTLNPNTNYYWSINSVGDSHTDSYPNDGKFHIVCQRSYRYLGSGAWHVFAEEHEQLWYPLLSENGPDWFNNSAYYYANNGTSVYYQKGDPVY